ncbi:MAG: hypothetical protein VCF24_19575 [Candidatus Latescibacterota bacterium]
MTGEEADEERNQPLERAAATVFQNGSFDKPPDPGFERRFGWREWRRRTPVLAAGFACGMGLIGMTGVAIALLRLTVSTTPW